MLIDVKGEHSSDWVRNSHMRGHLTGSEHRDMSALVFLLETSVCISSFDCSSNGILHKRLGIPHLQMHNGRQRNKRTVNSGIQDSKITSAGI